jgi:hypothetical protein
MKLLLSFLTATILALPCIAQRNCTPTKQFAFYSVVQPGNIPLDDNGVPRRQKPVINRTIYLISACRTKPEIGRITYNGINVDFTLERTEGRTENVGSDTDGNEVILRASAAGSIWKLIIGDIKSSIDHNKAKIMIYGKGKRSFALTIKTEKELIPLPAY